MKKILLTIAVLLFSAPAFATSDPDPNAPVPGLSAQGEAVLGNVLSATQQPMILCNTVDAMKIAGANNDPNTKVPTRIEQGFKASVLQTAGVNTGSAGPDDVQQLYVTKEGVVTYNGTDVTATLNAYCTNNNFTLPTE